MRHPCPSHHIVDRHWTVPQKATVKLVTCHRGTFIIIFTGLQSFQVWTSLLILNCRTTRASRPWLGLMLSIHRWNKGISAFLILLFAFGIASLDNWGTIFTTVLRLTSFNRCAPGSNHFVENTIRLPPLTYRSDLFASFYAYSLLALESWLAISSKSPDTTAVILNWSRFHNVQRIASLLCSPELDHIIKEVLIWNNNPAPIFYKVFCCI